MLQQHSQKVRIKSDVEGFLPDDDPWAPPLSPEEEYAVLILVSTRGKIKDEAEYAIRGERLRKRLPKKDTGKQVIVKDEVVEVLARFDRRLDTDRSDSEAMEIGEAEIMVHVRNSEGIEAWTRQGNVEQLLPAS
jgi:hypothetical protein